MTTACGAAHVLGQQNKILSDKIFLFLNAGLNLLILITRARVEYGRIFHERYFHELKARVNMRMKCPAILHDDTCNKFYLIYSTEKKVFGAWITNLKIFFKKGLWGESNLHSHLISLVLYQRARRELYGFSSSKTHENKSNLYLLCDWTRSESVIEIINARTA